jgi:hypothetical protein
VAKTRTKAPVGQGDTSNKFEVRPLVIPRGKKKRYEVSDDKAEHKKLVIQILNERRGYWPLTVRGVHYPLLNHDFIRGYYFYCVRLEMT